LTQRKLKQRYQCRRQASITVGINTQSTKPPLTLWLQAMYLVIQDKNRYFCHEASPSTWHFIQCGLPLKHKLMQVMMELDD
jgi:hypothetical protein